jgi:hypothetical protein
VWHARVVRFSGDFPLPRKVNIRIVGMQTMCRESIGSVSEYATYRPLTPLSTVGHNLEIQEYMRLPYRRELSGDVHSSKILDHPDVAAAGHPQDG